MHVAALREVEVVRDCILKAMSADTQLQPQDIQILLADPATYALLVMAGCNPSRSCLHLPLRFSV